MQAVVAQPSLAQALRAFAGLKLWKLETSYGDPAIIVEANGSLVLKGTDLALFLAYQVETLGAHAPGQDSVAVSYALLKNLVGRLPPKIPTTLQVTDRQLIVQAGDVEIALPGKPAADLVSFPDLTGGDSECFQVDPAVFRQAILEVVFAASSEELRPAMTAVLARLQGGTLTLVAADGFRLAKRTILVQAGTDEAADFLIPAAALKKLAGLLAKASAPVRVFLHRAEQPAPQERSVYNPVTQEYEPAAPFVYNAGYDRVSFQSGPLTLVANLVEARYPDYEAIIPTRYCTRLVVPRAELLARLQLLAPLIKEHANIMVLDWTHERLAVRDSAGSKSFPVPLREQQSTLNGVFLAHSGEREDGLRYEPSSELLATAAEVTVTMPWPAVTELVQGLARRGQELSAVECRAIMDLLVAVGVVDTPGVSGYPLRITDPEQARTRVAQWLRERHTCAFNVRYVLDLVAAMDTDAVAIDLQDNTRPGVFWPWSEEARLRRSDDALYVVMPMQV